MMSMMFASRGRRRERPRSFTPLTFDCLLNCLGSVERSDSVLHHHDQTFRRSTPISQRAKCRTATEFISTRPGRIDKTVGGLHGRGGQARWRRIHRRVPGRLDAMDDFLDKFPDLQETPAPVRNCGPEIAHSSDSWEEQEEELAPAAGSPTEV